MTGFAVAIADADFAMGLMLTEQRAARMDRANLVLG